MLRGGAGGTYVRPKALPQVGPSHLLQQPLFSLHKDPIISPLRLFTAT